MKQSHDSPGTTLKDFMQSLQGDDAESILKAADKSSLTELLHLGELETAMGLKPGFYESLVSDDDWSAVIKIHALFEAALTHILTVHFDIHELSETFSFLDTSSPRTGKLVFAKHAELVDKDSRRFISVLSQIRNQFVHDVSNVNRSLEEYFAEVGKKKTEEFRLAFCLGHKPGDDVQIQVSDDEYSLRGLVQSFAIACFNIKPLLSIWMSGSYCLREMYFQSIKSERDNLAAGMGRNFVVSAVREALSSDDV